MAIRRDKGGLGRGLSALMADVGGSVAESGTANGSDRRLPIEALVPNPNQPRRQFDPVLLAELTASISEKGIVQPLIVRLAADSSRFEIVAGERRWRAAQAAGLHEVPVLVRDYSDEEVLEIAIIENIQRSDLNAVEEAVAYRQLMDRFGHSQDKLATSLSRSRSYIANMLRLLTLPDVVQELVRSGNLTAGHARALITCPNATELAKEVIKRGLSVRETERLAKRRQEVRQPREVSEGKTFKDSDTIAIEGDLSANLGMKVTITHGGPNEGGTLTVSYRSLDDLDLLCDVLSKVSRNAKPS
jgi:ParB family chromosome partitioning protein